MTHLYYQMNHFTKNKINHLNKNIQMTNMLMNNKFKFNI